MFSWVKFPVKIIGFLEANISPVEVACGVCLAMFLGFVPLNGPTAFLIASFFFIFKLNRIATMLTLPIFKSLYVLGLSKVTDNVGIYLLQDADYLTKAWKVITSLPVVAYLELNYSMVIGGLAVSAILALPVFFLSRSAYAAMSAKYSEKISNTAFSKWVSGIKVAHRVGSIVGPDVGSTLGNLKGDLAKTIKTDMKARLFKKKASKRAPGSIENRINIKGALSVIVILVVLHFGVGIFVSPALTTIIIDNVNRACGTLISVEKLNLWPLTLSISVKGISVRDPDNGQEVIFRAKDASIRISLLGILSKRMAFSRIHITSAELNVEGYPDGKTNIGKLVPPKTDTAKLDADSVWRLAMKNKDWFGRAYEFIKNRFSKKRADEIKARKANAKKISKNVVQLERGKLVEFKKESGTYLFEIGSMAIDKAEININLGDGQTLTIKDAKLELGRLGFDPDNGANIDLFRLSGLVESHGNTSGGIDLLFKKWNTGEGENARFDLELKGVDLSALRYIYQDSLPIEISKGRIDLKSKTLIENGSLDSRNSFDLSQHRIGTKGGNGLMVGLIPVATIVEAINGMERVDLKFDVGGTVDKPEFKGFQDSLLVLVKPYIKNIQKRFADEGVKALQSLFKKE